MADDDDARTGTDDSKPDDQKLDAQPDTRTDDTDWKAESRKWEKRAKDNADAAKRLAEIEDAKKSEQDKLNEQLEAARREGTEAKTTALKMDVALDKAPEGMPLKQVRKLAKRLTGSTREELEPDADELFAEFKQSGSSNGRPAEKLTKVPIGTNGAPTTDMNEWMRAKTTR